MKNKVIITIPAQNEEKTIGILIEKIKSVMNKTNYDYKIIVVDDASNDNTKKIAEEYGAVVFSNFVRRGLAEVYRTEMKKSLELNPDAIVHIDADLQYSPNDIPKLIQPILNDEADLVLGNRFQGGIEEMSIMKKLGNKALSYAISRITKYKVGDVQTGFRAMNKRIAEIPITSDHTYTQEVVIKAIRNGYRVKEIPAYFSKRDHGNSKLLKNPFEYAIKAWINIIRIYRDFDPLKFFGKIGLSLIFLGLLSGAFVIIDFIIRKNVGHLPMTILTVLLIVLGVQIIIFGFLADMNKKLN